MLSIDSDIKLRWDLFVIVLATYNCFQIPLEVAFDPPELRESYLRFLTYFIDTIFVVDILIAFRTTYIDERSGLEINNQNLVAKRYLKG